MSSLRSDLFRHPRRLPLIAPSILSADFARLGEECRAVLDHGADLLHLDVMDGHFVPNLTMGPALCASLRKALPDAALDVHLMVRDPAAYVAPFVDAGADLLTFHIEVAPDPRELAATIRSRGILAGLALNPDADVERVLPYLDSFDLILVMSVFPGFSGQRFIPDVLAKAKAISPRLRPEQRLEIDGGVGPATAPLCRDAGCDLLVAASAIFHSTDYGAAISTLRGPSSAPRMSPAPGAGAGR